MKPYAGRGKRKDYQFMVHVGGGVGHLTFDDKRVGPSQIKPLLGRPSGHRKYYHQLLVLWDRGDGRPLR